MNTCNVTIKHFSFHVNRTDQVTRKPNNQIKINKRGVFGLSVFLSKFFIVAMTSFIIYALFTFDEIWPKKVNLFVEEMYSEH
jgi:hypothetical protein